MASETDLCNRALQKLGAKRIVSLEDDSTNARACKSAYYQVRDSALRAHPWNFAIRRAQLPASSTAPLYGPANAYPLPSDWLRLLPTDPRYIRNDNDWQIENGSIVTDDSAPLSIRYIARIEDPNQFDTLFDDVVSTELAIELCEELTQSNTKKAQLENDLKETISDARRTNAIENIAQEPPEDTWITARY